MQAQSRRKFQRYQYEAPIQYLYLQPDRYYNSRALNYSERGLYFESFQSLDLNSQISIIMPNYSSGANGPDAFQSYLAVIRWCKKISDKKSSRFGIGVEILEKSHERPTSLEIQKRQACDLCDAILLMDSVCRIDGSICLCPDCYDRWDEMPEGKIKAGIKRFLDRNVL